MALHEPSQWGNLASVVSPEIRGLIAAFGWSASPMPDRARLLQVPLASIVNEIGVTATVIRLCKMHESRLQIARCKTARKQVKTRQTAFAS